LEGLSALAARKSCHLYFFGNPLALRSIKKLDDFKSIVCAFQGFEASQSIAAKQLLGQTKAVGAMPELYQKVLVKTLN
jgi:hypothetical protein